MLYMFLVWLHILVATLWVGGMLFLVFVVVPWLRTPGGRKNAGVFLRETGVRFRNVAWWCFGILFVTGAANLWYRGVRLENFVESRWLASPFGQSVVRKLGLFVLVLLISAVHDFVVGPRATAAIIADPRSEEAQVARKRASILGRVNVLLALAIVALAVTIVRGWPHG